MNVQTGMDSVSTALIWSGAQADARAFGAARDPRRLLSGVLATADAVIILASAAGAHVLRNGPHAVPTDVASTALLAAVMTFNGLLLCGAYSRHVLDRVPQQASRAVRVWTGVFVMLVLLAYLTKTSDSFSRTWAILWFVAALLGLLCARWMAVRQVRSWRARGRLAGTVAIVDLCGSGDLIGRHIRRQYQEQAQLVGVFRAGDGSADTIADLLALSRLFRIDDVLVLASSCVSVDVGAVVRRLSVMPTNVVLCPMLPELHGVPICRASVMYDLPALTIHRKPFGGFGGVFKRAEDLLVGALALLAAAPAMLLIAACIRADTRGPVLFRQARQGFNNNTFIVYKFRTMTHVDSPEADVPQATRQDPRVTRVGRILRRTSLDELPQLLNVLRGEMSLVGPRPHAVAHNQHYATLIDEYLGRHKVQPGITGWAQINGLRGETETLEKMQQRVLYDIAYIDDWSIWFDIKVLILTVFTVLFDRRAY